MSIWLVIFLIIYFIIAVAYGILSYVLIISDIELLDILDRKSDIYLTAILCGLFWVITIPILIYNSYIKDNNKE